MFTYAEFKKINNYKKNVNELKITLDLDAHMHKRETGTKREREREIKHANFVNDSSL